MYHITGRYKELIIGAGGENIAPVPVEDAVKNVANGVSNFLMIGDQRKFNTALVTLKAVGANGEHPGGDDLDPTVLGISPGSSNPGGDDESSPECPNPNPELPNSEPLTPNP